MMKVFLDTNILMDFVDNRENREHLKSFFCRLIFKELFIIRSTLLIVLSAPLTPYASDVLVCASPFEDSLAIHDAYVSPTLIVLPPAWLSAGEGP